MDLLHKHKSSGISSLVFGHILSFNSTRWPRVVSAGNSSQEYTVETDVSQGFIVGQILFLLYINDLAADVLSNMAVYSESRGV